MVYDPRQDSRYSSDKVFLSLLRQESRFNPNAVSPTGARGYAQILPSTARDPGFGLTPNIAVLTDPKQNVEFGKSYFDMLRKRYKGDEAAALVGYNGGPVAADRWLKSGKNDKVISKESSNYYKTILNDKTFGNNALADKPRVRMPDAEEDEAPRTVTGKKISVRATEEASTPTEPVEKASNALTSNDDTDTSAKPTVKSTSSSSDDDDNSSKSTSFDLGGDFSKVKKVPQLQSFDNNFSFQPVPIRMTLRDDPRNR